MPESLILTFIPSDQVFTQEAIQTAFDLTQGQPWLVNALAKEIVEEMVTDTTVAITPKKIGMSGSPEVNVSKN